jgi:hypothetical protein
MRTRSASILLAFMLAACSSSGAGARDSSLGGGDALIHDADAASMDGSTNDGGGGQDAAACVPTQAHAIRACVGDVVRWFDDCGTPNDQIKSCGGRGCSAGQCIARSWFPLGASEFGPWTSTTTWGSGTGYGVSGKHSYQAWEASIGMDPTTGTPIVAFDDADGISTRVRVVALSGASFTDVGGAPLGSFGPQGTSGRQPSLAVGSDGKPMAAWIQNLPGAHFQVYFRQWSGSAWTELGGSATGGGVSNDTGDTGAPALAIDAQNAPAIVWQASSSQIALRRWNGTAWVGLGGSDSGAAWTSATNHTFAPSIAFDRAGHPYVAFCESSTGLKVRAWTGSAWTALGSSVISTSTTQAECAQTRIAIDAGDRPIVSWIGGGGVFLRRWTGVQWEELGGSGSGLGLTGPSSAYEFSMALESNGDPIVAWRGERPNDGVNAFSVFLLQWNGTAWTELGGSASGYGMSGDRRETVAPSITVDASDHPYAAWQVIAAYPSDTSIVQLRYWDGTRWAELGQPSPNPGGISNSYWGARYPRMALDSNLNPSITWFDRPDPQSFPQILFRRFNGSIWEELAGSGTGLGISDGMRHSEFPSIALDDAGNPIIAWTEYTETNNDSEAYLKRWSGTAWEEIAGSATGGAISNTSGRAIMPFVALDGGRAPVVAWAEQLMVADSVYLRRFDGSAWSELGGSGHGMGVSTTREVAVLGISQNGQPIIGWTDPSHTIQIRRWDGMTWAPFAGGGFDPSPDDVFSFTMAVGPNDEMAIAWDAITSTTTDNAEIHLRLWDGMSWRSLAGSGTGPGISANRGYSVEPSIAFDELGRPIISWRDTSNGTAEILLRRWDGFRWDDVLGSGSGGGVSRALNDTESAEIAYRNHRLCVTWSELGGYAQQIVLRCVEFEPD